MTLCLHLAVGRRQLGNIVRDHALGERHLARRHAPRRRVPDFRRSRVEEVWHVAYYLASGWRGISSRNMLHGTGTQR